MTTLTRWTPAVLLGLAAAFTVAIDTQRSMPLRAPLDTAIPGWIANHQARQVDLASAVLAVAVPTAYLNRVYEADSGNDGEPFSLYIAYYDHQTQGRTIHSPKNCLPGSGWEPLTSQLTTVRTASGPQTVNRYVLQRGQQRVLVLYWYQGRGRIQASEYWVKFDLMRDAALRQRSEEALVRIVVPLTNDEQGRLELAGEVAGAVINALDQALPL